MARTYDAKALSSYVRWYVSHSKEKGYSDADIYERTMDRFGRYASKATNQAIDYWQSNARYAQNLSGRSDSVNMARLRPPSRTGGTDRLHVDVNVEISDPSRPRSGRQRMWNLTDDFDKPKTLGELREMIRDRVAADIAKKYDLREGNVRRRITAIHIVGIEGF